MSKAAGELTFGEVVNRYPEVPRIVTLKIDTAIRGVKVSDRAFDRARESNSVYEEVVYQHGKPLNLQRLGGAVFRDGTWLCGMESARGTKMLRRGNPFTLDVVDDRLMLMDGKQPMEECFFVAHPEFYSKKTSRGTPMRRVVSAGPSDCLNIQVYMDCRFWLEKQPCKYCQIMTYKGDRRAWGRNEAEMEDIYETVTEALQEPGRWTGIRLISGSDYTGAVPYENEVNEYLKVLSTLRRCFGSKDIPVRLVSSAFPEEQQVRLAEAGATCYEVHIEVWDEKIWEWVCPGKAKWFGRQYWIDSAIASAKVFGRGNVCTQLVAGAEMTQPYGFKTIDEALASSLEGAEFFARHDIPTSSCVLWVGQGSIFYKQKQKPAPLEYYVRLASGLREIRRAHKLGMDFNDYRRCAIHPDADLSRLDYPEVEI